MRRFVASAVVLLAVASYTAPASAATICVGTERPECAAPVETNLQTALTRAASASGGDLVLLGPGTYTTTAVGGFSVFDSAPIEVRGAGPQRTLLRSTATAPTAVLEVRSATPADARVTNLGLLVRSPANGGTALRLRGVAEDVAAIVEGNDPQSTSGFSLESGSVARRVTAVAQGPFAVGIDGRGITVEDAVLRATIGLVLAGDPSTVRRARVLSTRSGVDLCNASAIVENSTFEVQSGTGLEVEGSQRCGAGASVMTARNLTIVAAGGARLGIGIEASASNSNPIADVRDTVLRGLATSVRARPLPGGVSTLTLERLAEEPGRRDLVPGSGSLAVTDRGGHVSADPLLVDVPGGDLRPGPGSPLIDAGTPGALEPGASILDVAGLSRLLDGDGDGVARRDIGAHEAPAPLQSPPPPPVPMPPPGPVTPVIAPGPAPADRTRPALSRARLLLARRSALTVRSTEAASLRLEIRVLPAECRRASPRCRERTVATRTVRIARGANRVAISATLATRLRARGASLRLRATDPTGNASALLRVTPSR